MADVASLGIAVDSSKVRSAGIDLDRLASSARRAETSAGGLSRQAQKSARDFQSLGSSVRSFASVLAGAFSVRAITNLADATTNLQSGLKLVSNGTAEVASAQAGLLDIAQRTRSSYTELGKTYASLARAAEPLGLSQERLLNVTKAIAQASQIGGGSRESINAALIQLGQGIASGTLRGEELNSVLEQTPRLARAIADSIGRPVGELRKLAEEGRITSEVVIQALEQSAGKLDSEFKQLTPKIDGALNTLTNGFAKAIEEFEKSTGTFRSLAEGIVNVSNALVDVARYFGEASRAGNGFFSGLGLGARQLLSGESAQSLGAKIAPLQAERAALTRRQAGGGFTPEDGVRLGQINAEIAGYEKQLKLVQNLTKVEVERQTATNRVAAPGGVVALPGGKVTGQASAAAAAARAAKEANDQRILAAEQVLGIDEASLRLQADITRAYEDFDRKRSDANEKAIEAGNRQAEQLKDMADRYRDLGDPVATYIRQIQEVTALEAIAELSAEEAFNARLKLYESADKASEGLKDKVKEQKTLAEELGLTFQSAAEDAIVSFKSLGDVIEGVLKDILRIAVRRNITEPLGNALGSIFGGIFGGTKKASGGYISGPGTSTSDSIPARLSNGEYVVRASAVKKIGVGALDAINSGMTPRRFNQGGFVGTASAGSMRVQIINNTPAQVTTRQSGDGGLQVLIENLEAELGSRLANGVGGLNSAVQGRFGLKPSMGF